MLALFLRSVHEWQHWMLHLHVYAYISVQNEYVTAGSNSQIGPYMRDNTGTLWSEGAEGQKYQFRCFHFNPKKGLSISCLALGQRAPDSYKISSKNCNALCSFHKAVKISWLFIFGSKCDEFHKYFYERLGLLSSQLRWFLFLSGCECNHCRLSSSKGQEILAFWVGVVWW